MRRFEKIEYVGHLVSNYFGIDFKEMCSYKRDQRISIPRQFAHTIAKDLRLGCYAEIGEYIGGRDHSTVMHSGKAIRALIQSGYEMDGVTCSDIYDKLKIECERDLQYLVRSFFDEIVRSRLVKSNNLIRARAARKRDN